MEFAALSQPAALWALLALPVLWWLALPPRPRRRVLTAHLQQWLAAQAALRRRPPRLLRLRLLLLLIAAAATVLAFSGPKLADRDGPRRLLVLLDNSASTAAQDADGNDGNDAARLRAELQRGLAAVPDHVEVRLLELAGAGRVHHGAAARHLPDPGPPHGTLPSSLQPLWQLAERDAVWLLTDGQLAPPPTLPNLAVTRRGVVADNWAITAVQCRDAWPAARLHVTVTVAAFAGTPRALTLSVAGAVNEVAPRTVSLLGDSTAECEFELERQPAGGELTFALDAGDALPTDDRVVLALPPLPFGRIGYQAEAESPGGPALAAVATALAEEIGGTAVADPRADDRLGFLLLEGGRAAPAAGSHFASFGTAPPGATVTPVHRPLLLDWRRDHALLVGLDLSELVVDEALRLEAAGTVLVRGQDQAGQELPLLWLHEGALQAAFRLQDSNLALLPALPQLLRRALVQSYGEAVHIVERVPPVEAAESDLRRRNPFGDRPLPPFGADGAGLSALCLLLALAALALRAWLR